MLDLSGNEQSVYGLLRGGFSVKGRGRLCMTSMIDIIFLLLVFFVLTAEFDLPEQFIDLRLPEQSGNVGTAQLVEPMDVVIRAAGDGVVVGVGGVEEVGVKSASLEVGLSELYDVVGDVTASQHRILSDPVRIVCGDDVSWDYLAKVYNLLGVCGMNNVTFVLEGFEE